MTPEQIAGESEHSQQAALFCWAAASVGTFPQLQWMFAIPNGGDRGDSMRSRAIHGGAMKAEGVKAGVADIMLPFAAHGMHGLFIEMKKCQGGVASKDQKDFGKHVQANGYGFCICHGWIEAKNILIQYLT